MIRFDNKNYRIEEFKETPLRFALDRKEIVFGRVCLVNIGWFHCYEHALQAMRIGSEKQQ